MLMQATIQKHIDHAISSTVNIPRESTEEDVSRIYIHAWKMGCKGITVYREGSREGILISEDESKRKSAESNTAVQAKESTLTPPRQRPKVTEGRTERIETPRGPIYITINEDEMGLCEVFVKSLDAEAEVTGRLVSLLFRAGVDPREIMEQLWHVRSREVAFDRSVEGTNVPITTVAQGVALGIGRYLYGDGFNPQKEYPRASSLPDPVRTPQQLKLKFGSRTAYTAPVVPHDKKSVKPAVTHLRNNREFVGICPDCGESLIHENGCTLYRGCGFSKCG